MIKKMTVCLTLLGILMLMLPAASFAEEPKERIDVSIVGTQNEDLLTWTFDEKDYFLEGFATQNYTGTLPELTAFRETGGARFTEEGFFTYRIPVNMANYYGKCKLKLKLLKGYLIQFSVDNVKYTDIIDSDLLNDYVSGSKDLPENVTYDELTFESTIIVPKEAIAAGRLFVRVVNPTNINREIGSIVKLGGGDGPYLFSLKLVEYYEGDGVPEKLAVPQGGVDFDAYTDAEKNQEYIEEDFCNITLSGQSEGVYYANGKLVYKFPVSKTAEKAVLSMQLNRNFDISFSTDNGSYEPVTNGKECMSYFVFGSTGVAGAFPNPIENFNFREFILDRKYIQNGAVWVSIDLDPQSESIQDANFFYVGKVKLLESTVKAPEIKELMDEPVSSGTGSAESKKVFVPPSEKEPDAQQELNTPLLIGVIAAAVVIAAGTAAVIVVVRAKKRKKV